MVSAKVADRVLAKRAPKNRKNGRKYRMSPRSLANLLPPWAKGTRPVGRAKGTPNVFNLELKQVILLGGANAGTVIATGKPINLEALHPLEAYMTWLALEKPNVYGALVGRVIPTQHDATVRDENKPFESEEEYRQACIEMGLAPERIYQRITYKPVPQDEERKA
jgi:hypothetical protein